MSRETGRRRHDIAGAVPAEFGPLLPRLAADLASGAPDLDAVERALRDSLAGRRRGGPEASAGAAGRDAAGPGVRGPAAGRWPGIR